MQYICSYCSTQFYYHRSAKHCSVSCAVLGRIKRQNDSITTENGICLLPLRLNKFAQFDSEDLELVRQSLWRLQVTKYPEKFYVVSGAHPRIILLHRVLTEAPKNKYIDHANGDGLDNSRKNIRVCTPSQNGMNREGYGSSSFKGVYKSNGGKDRWKASIQHKNKQYHLGCFGSKEAAALAYDERAKELFGKFALLNFPVSQT